MERTLKSFFIFILTSFAIITSAGEAKAQMRLMPLGNSITEGAGSSHNGGYRRDLYYLLKNAGVAFDFVGALQYGNGFPDIDHEGHAGFLANQLDVKTYLAGNPADAVFLEAGTNNISYSESASEVYDDITKIVDDIYQVNPAIAIYLSTVIPRRGTTGQQQVTDELNAMLPGLVSIKANAGYKIYLVDIAARFKSDPGWQTNLMADPVHPNDAGYSLMAAEWFEAYLVNSQPRPAVFADDFNLSSLNYARWRLGRNDGNRAGVSGNRLQLKSEGRESGWVITHAAYAARHTTVTVKVIQPNDDGNIGISPTYNLASQYGIFDQPNWYRFYLYRPDGGGAYRLNVESMKNGEFSEREVTGNLLITGVIYLRLRFDEAKIHFEASLDGQNWTDTYSETFALPGYSLDSPFYYELAAYKTSELGELVVDDFSIISSDNQPPQLSAIVAQNFAGSSAQIVWQTNEPADTQVDYGLNANYSQTSPLSATRVTAHAATLNGLTQNTTYHYRVKSRDLAGNLAVSGDFVFTTPPATALMLLSPNGGEWLLNGGSQRITWNAPNAIANVKLEFSADAGASWRTIAESAPNTGSYNWQPPDAVSNNVLLRISDANDAGVADVSDQTFFITRAALVKFKPATNNPILAPGPKGSWDENIRERGWVMYENGMYHLWYGGWRGDYIHSEPALVKLGYAFSTDGVNWTKYAGNPIHTANWTEDITVLKDGNTYYLYAEDENSDDGNGATIDLYTSTDRINWTRHGTVLAPDGSGWEAGDVGTPTVWKEDGTWYMLYEGLVNGVAGQVGLATSSDGKSWTRSTSNPVLANPIHPDLDIAIDSVIKINGVYHAYGHYDIGGTRWVGGLFTSTNLTKWSAYSGNPIAGNSPVIVAVGENYRLYSVEGNSSGQTIYKVAFSFVDPPTGVAASAPLQPDGFMLHPNYPNPLRPAAAETRIVYQLQERAFVTLTIYDLLGREIKTLVEQKREAGTYEARWNGRDANGNLLPSGTYLYIMQAGEFRRARKLLLVK
jgi:lysophospholipase L1-like esterase